MMILVGGLLFLAVAGVGFAFAGGGGQAKTVNAVQRSPPRPRAIGSAPASSATPPKPRSSAASRSSRR